MVSKTFTKLKFIPLDPPYYQFAKLAMFPFLSHGIFTRHGGKSLAPFDSLNVGDTVDDLPETVALNIETIKRVMGAGAVVHMNQVHGTHIRVLENNSDLKPSADSDADALITRLPRVALLTKQADCQGVIIFDPQKKVVSNVHCGWRGNVQNILGRVVGRMGTIFGCRPQDLVAVIGPSLGPCCAEFKSYKDIFPKSFRAYGIGKDCFDLWRISSSQLESAGLKAANIEVAGVCTSCSTDQFYSYRKEKNTGRFGTVAMLV